MRYQQYIVIFFIVLSTIFSIDCIADQDVDDDSLNMGIFPRQSAKVTIKLFKPMADFLASKLNRKIKLKISKDFVTFWHGVEDQHFDIVHYNQYHYALSHSKYGYSVILKNNEFGAATIAGSIIVRADSGINTISDLKGKKLYSVAAPEQCKAI